MIHATGELEASEKLKEAAEVLNQAPNAIQLRYMHTLTEITNEKSHTIVFPMPVDLLDSIAHIPKKSRKI